MLHLTADSTEDSIIVTLNEKKTLSDPTYHFAFTQVVTKETVSFDIPSTEDISNYQDRYNEFLINTSVLFSGKQPGQWHYIITELGSGLEMENGKMKLAAATNFAFSGYEPAATYKGYTPSN